jgi:O-antigen ligase
VAQWLQIGEATDSAEQLLEGSPTDRVVYSCLLAIGIVILVRRRKQIGRLLWANGPIVLVFFYCLVSLLWSDFPAIAFKRWIKAVSDFVMVLIVLSDPEPLDATKRLLARMTYVLIPLSILLIKYYPELGVGYGPWGGRAFYMGVTTNKNSLGVICLCLGLGALWRLIAAYQGQEPTGRIRRMMAQCVILAMVLWLFSVADSMTALYSFLMASILLLATSFRGVLGRPAVVHLLTAAMLAVAISVLFLGISPGALEVMGRNATLTDRTELWGRLLSLVQSRLFGTGFESFWLGPRLEKTWSWYWWHPNEAHNGYLEIFLNLGWTGVALLVVLIATGYRTVFGAWRNNLSTGNLRLAYFFVGLVYNFTEAAFFKMLAPAWLFFLFAIVRVPAASYRKVKVRPPAQNVFKHRHSVAWEQATLNEKVV